MKQTYERVQAFLRWTERFTKTDMVYASRSGFWLMLGQVFGALISFALSVIFAHFLPKELFGTYRYILSVAGLATAFSLTGMNTAVIRAVAQGVDGILKPSLIVQLRWSIFQFLFSVGTSFYYFYYGNTLYGWAFLIVAVCAPLSSIMNTYSAFLQGKKDFRRLTVYGSLSNIGYFVAMAAAALFVPNVLILIVAFYLASIVANAWFTWRTLKLYRPKNQELRAEDISYGKHISFMNIIATIASQIDSIVVFHFLGPIQLAVYTFATIIPERLKTMFNVVGIAALPKFAAATDETAHHLSLRKKIVQLIGLSLVMIVGYYIFAPLVYKIFFPQYMDALGYSQVYALSLIVIAAYIPLPSLFARRKQKELYVINVGLPIFKIVATILFIMLWGIWGAIIAKLSYYVLQLALSSALALKKSA